MKNLLEKIVESRNIKMIIYIMSAFIFLMFFSAGTSFLYKAYGWDSSVFVYTGQMMLEGKQLYSELFDHKGPMIFIINAIGQMIYHGKSGIFILQVINISIVLGLIYKIANQILKNKKISFFIPFLFLAFFGTTITDGNLTEEWNLALILIPVFLFVKYILNVHNKLEHKPSNALIYGICSAIVAFTRFNNLVSIAAIILFITIILIKNKKFDNLIKNAIQFLIGFSIITVPLIAYFFFANTLGLMIDASILYNFKYATTNVGGKNIFIDVVKDSKFIVPIFISVMLYARSLNIDEKNRTIYVANIVLTLITVSSMILGQNYEHYYTLMLIPLTLNYILIFKVLTEMKYFKVTLTLVLICTIIFLIPRYYDTYIGKKNIVNEVKYNEIIKINQIIPNEDKDRVLVYNQFCNIQIYNEYRTNFKYFMLQGWMMILDENIRNEMIDYLMSDNRPNWIILDKRLEKDEFIENMMEDNYFLKEDTGTYLIYQSAQKQIYID